MKNFSGLLLVLVLMLLASCSSKHEQLIAEIKKMEEIVRNQPLPSKDEGGKLISKYLEFADAFPEDSLTPAMLYNASRVSLSISDPEQAVSLLLRLADTYPESKPVADAYVFLGFIYETVFNDYKKARQWYELFLKDFPNHAMYEDVSFSMRNLGKTPEELIAEFLKQAEEGENK